MNGVAHCRAALPDGGSLKPRHALVFSIWIVYVFFVAYGSLVPLRFRALPLDQAWEIFQHIPMLNLGIDSRADWIANGVLYVPVGFLTAHLLTQRTSKGHRIHLLFLAGLFSVALAFAVEFAQIFFPQRTVSLNDLLAETIGSLIGLVLAARFSGWFRILLEALSSDPRRLAFRLLEAYCVGYVAFSLFPYDILLSWTEIEQKLQGASVGWLLAGDSRGRSLIALKLLAETILTLPFGVFLGYRSSRQTTTYGQAALVGVLLGGVIEIAELFTATGVTQGLSILTRVAGVCCGLALWHRRSSWFPERIAALIQRHSLPLGTIYLVVLLHVNGWFSLRWSGTDIAVSTLSNLHFLPFYYHYFTTEAKALFSLASVFLMYLPIGLLTWSNRGGPSRAFVYALFAATLVETGKLFLDGTRPDPTNILLAALAGWVMVHLARTLSAAARMTTTGEISAHRSEVASPPAKHSIAPEMPARHWTAFAIMAPSLAFAAYWAATFPTQPVVLCLFLTVCAALIWHRPIRLVSLLLAALPVLDLAPLSGRFYLDEFDLLLLISVAIGYARIPSVPAGIRLTDGLFKLASALLALSFAIAAMRGLTPWQAPGANSYSNYFSAFNALRIGKGALWAFLIYGLLRRFIGAEMDINRPLAVGMTCGLALTVAVTLWERATFVNLFDFSSGYRVTGPFSAMHTGGAYIECFLAIATPFLILLVLQSRTWTVRLTGAFLLITTTYALMVTFSRIGYSAFGVAVAITLFFTLRKSAHWRPAVLIVTLAGAMLAVALPIFNGQFAQSRMATVSQDYAIRQNHWKDALEMRTPDMLTTLFGMGLGRYPESHYLLSREDNKAASFQLMTEDDNTFLRLVSASSIYVEQLVPVTPGQVYVLKIDARANRPNVTIAAPICEKWMLTSYNCIWNSLKVGNEAGVWHHLEAKVTASSLSINPWYSRRPIKLALYNGSADTIVDFDNVRLETINGENLLSNGDFSENLDHWFFSTDNHLQWHTKSLLVAVLFDQGWFGLLALGLFSLLAIHHALGRAWQGDLQAAAVLASFSAFLVVGLFDTLIDAPRFLFLYLLLGGFCAFPNFTRRQGQLTSPVQRTTVFANTSFGCAATLTPGLHNNRCNIDLKES